MRATAILLIMLAACTPSVVEKPVMAPVDHPRAPRGIGQPCENPAFDPIRLPTDAAEQIGARQVDQDAATDAIDTCEGRRARAVQYIRRLGINVP